MFKSILPSRRFPSSDFPMLTTPIDPVESDANGKENYFAIPYDTNTTTNAKPKTEKRKKMKGKALPEQETPEDFDRLLVSLRVPLDRACAPSLVYASISSRIIFATVTLSMVRSDCTLERSGTTAVHWALEFRCCIKRQLY